MGNSFGEAPYLNSMSGWEEGQWESQSWLLTTSVSQGGSLELGVGELQRVFPY